MPISWFKKFFIKFLLPLALFVFLAYIARWSNMLREEVFPYPHEIILVGLKSMGQADIAPAVLITLRRLSIAFIVSFIIGGFMGFLFHQFRILEEIFAMPIDIIRSIPVVTLFPIFISIWGFGEATFLAVPVVLTSVIMYIHLAAGLDRVVNVRQQLMRRWGASRWQLLKHLLLPSIAPHLFTSMRVCISLQLILVLVAEMFLGAKDGLGTLIYDYQTILEYEKMYFFIVVAGIIGWVINSGLAFLQRKIIFWEDTINGF